MQIIIDIVYLMLFLLAGFFCGVAGFLLGKNSAYKERNCEECFLRKLKEETKMVKPQESEDKE